MHLQRQRLAQDALIALEESLLKTAVSGGVGVTAQIVHEENFQTQQGHSSASSVVRANTKTVQERPSAKVVKLELPPTLLQRSYATSVVQGFLLKTVVMLCVRNVKSGKFRASGGHGHATLVLLELTVSSQAQQGVHCVRLGLITGKKAGNGVSVVIPGSIPHK